MDATCLRSLQTAPFHTGVNMVRRLVILLVLLPSAGCSAFTASAIKQEFATAYEGIKADLDFHESEGLETFDPKSAAIVRAMRNEAASGQ